MHAQPLPPRTDMSEGSLEEGVKGILLEGNPLSWHVTAPTLLLKGQVYVEGITFGAFFLKRATLSHAQGTPKSNLEGTDVCVCVCPKIGRRP